MSKLINKNDVDTLETEEMLEVFNKNPALVKLINILIKIFANEKDNVALAFIMYVLAIFSLNRCGSIRSTFRFFLSYFGFKLSNIYYYFSGTAVDISAWQLALIHTCVKLIPAGCKIPLGSIIDDSLVEKLGKHFEACSKLHDHACHNGTYYLHGHCFVCLLLLIPIKKNGSYHYLKVPIGYTLWVPRDECYRNRLKFRSKYEIAADMLEVVHSIIGSEITMAVICDAWYPKKDIIDFIKKYDNVEAMVSVRIDTALYDLKPDKTGTRGRPRVRGKRLNIQEDFELIDVPDVDYKVGYRRVLTNLFGQQEVLAIVTEKSSASSRRLFLCTNPELCKIDLDLIKDKNAKAIASIADELLCYGLFSLRWSIETMFQEEKAFWGITKYMVRSVEGIERLVNIESLAYAVLCILPSIDSDFAFLEDYSIQDRRFEVGSRLNRYVILSNCADELASQGNSSGAEQCRKMADSCFTFGDVGN